MKYCFGKLIFFLLALNFIAFAVFSQTGNTDSLKIDSLKIVLSKQKDDTSRINTLNDLSSLSRQTIQYPESIQYAEQALVLAQKSNFKIGIADAYLNIGYSYSYRNNSTDGLNSIFTGIKILEQSGYKKELADAYYNVAGIYSTQRNYASCLKYGYAALQIYQALQDKKSTAGVLLLNAGAFLKQNNLSDALKNFVTAKSLFDELKDKYGAASATNAIGDVFLKQKKYTGALKNYKEAQKFFESSGDIWWVAWSYESEADVYYTMALDNAGNNDQSLDSALINYSRALNIFKELRNEYGISTLNIYISRTYIKLNNFKAALPYLDAGFELAKRFKYKENLRNAFEAYSKIDSAQGNFTKAYSDYKSFIIYSDSISNDEKTKNYLQVKLEYEFNQKELLSKAVQDKKDAESKRIKNQQYFVIAVLAIVALSVVIIAFIQYLNSKQKQTANTLLTQQKEKIEAALTKLKSAQAQLIQSEKMASLGELTAGIAHEIQNPLNFVNNFSEINKEMLEDLKAERLKPKAERDDLLEDELINDVIGNEEKINHHGKRADAIVKGMLQHSRKNAGQKELTDINALCDEYLRLSYHGLRAKDKSFNADFKTDFDESISKINIVPQDIGRVLLNLYNNAFYAVNEKLKAQSSKLNAEYKPTVSIQTKKINDKIEIRVRDNGNGIPSNIIEKIFQPFFTTKPTGQGTGLGLSLAYDIITKEHNGTIKAESKEGEGTEFIIALSYR